MGPVLLNLFFPELGALSALTSSVIIGVVVTLVGIAIIGVAGGMKSASLSEDEKKEAVKDFNFPKGLAIALLAGFMSGCFNVGLEFGKELNFGELTHPMFRTLPATLLVTVGGFLTNAAYCLFQNSRNRTFADYKDGKLWASNILFCALAGLLWYSQFFGLSLGRSFFEPGGVMDTLSFCILMALNVTFSNVWGIVLKETNAVIGDVSIFDIENARMGSVGYRLDPDLWGHGYVTEALRAAVEFIFTHTELDRLHATADVRNTASNRVLEKCGFVHEGTIRHGKMVSVYCDYHIWGLLREDWEQMKATT